MRTRAGNRRFRLPPDAGTSTGRSWILHRYLTTFGGARFNQLANRQRPDEFTREDFLAVRKLNVSVLRTAPQSLLGEAKPVVRRLLRAIPDDLDIWEVPTSDYDFRLGPDSAAWQLWQLVFEKQKGARSSGRGVTAGKLPGRGSPRQDMPYTSTQATG